jgi:hypothetical protein
MNNFETYKLDEKIYVYRNAFKNSLEFIDKVQLIDRWVPWYTFGEMLAPLHGGNIQSQTFPSYEEWVSVVENTSDDFIIPVQDIFYKVTKDYIEKTGIKLDNWIFNAPSICKYNPDFGVTDDLVMHYHTDYQQEKSDEPGQKFGITCTMYLNDEYDGGDIMFKIFDKENYVKIDFKPKAGDIVIFPSAEPYYHGVKKVEKSEKYFIRCFWKFDSPGTQEWFDNQAFYGKQKWEEMEHNRWNEGFKNGTWVRND